MKNHRIRLSFILSLPALATIILIVAPLVRAGGPLLLIDGQPVRWASHEVRGGALNSATVDSEGRVLYHVDSGALGSLTEAQATAFVDRIFGLYTGVPTASIEFLNAGRIVDPTTNQPVDVNGSNMGRFLSSSNPTFQNPIIFDSDGSITGSGGVLGFFGFLQFDRDTAELREGMVVLNGRALTNGSLSTSSFLGVFTHEFGHFAGPLDHSQVNGNIAANGEGAVLPAGFTEAQAFDLFAPFTETMYPFLFDAPAGSQLSNPFEDSGFFIATLDMDTQNALSNLYPTADYLSSRGSIEGRVRIDFGEASIPISGINVVARRIDQGPYPPSLNAAAFPAAPVVDGDGVPQIPPAQLATDTLSTMSSAVTGLEFGAGMYRIQGLPPGQYMVQIQQIIPDAIGGSGIGPLNRQFPLPIKEEFFNGPGSSSNSPSVFLPVTVNAGALTSGIDIILNGFSAAPPVPVDETEPNENKKNAPRLNIPVQLSASVSSTDLAKLRMTLPDGSRDFVEDLYRITVDQARPVYIILESTSGSGDLDLYLWSSTVSKKKTSLDDPNLLSFSAGPTSSELIAFELEPGTYVVGVSAFSGSLNYKMLIFTTQ